MRRALYGLIVSTPLLLSSCATMQPGQLNDLVSQIQAQTRAICSFVPLASDVAILLSGGSLTSVGALANAICQALAARRTAPRIGAHVTVVVNGIPVRGTRVRR